MKLYFSLLLALIVLSVDLLTKHWAESSITYGQQIAITDFFNLVLAYNAGAAFSFLSDASGWQRWFLSSVALLVSLIIIYLLYKNTTNRLLCIALSLILGGALGNFWDRVTLGHVVDFLDFHYAGYHWPAFNVADSAIFCGVCLMLLDSVRTGRNGSSSE